MKKKLIVLIKQADKLISRFYLKFFNEKNSLTIFLFHGLFKNEKDKNLNIVNPQQGITLEHFRQFIEYYLDNDFIFVSPDDILNGLNSEKKYILITFDDGYFNNYYALQLLQEYKVPAVFFTAINHIISNKCFWSDVLYRERIKRGLSVKSIFRERNHLVKKTNKEIERYIINLFGEKAFNPLCDIDRPFTPSELKKFSKEKYVFLGNHTNDHAILTNYTLNNIRHQIINAQHSIFKITGINPLIIAYPYGNYSNKIIKISVEIGLKLGITIDPGKNYLPIDLQSDEVMCLKRFTLWSDYSIQEQCKFIQSDISIYNWCRNFFKRKLNK